MIFNFKQFINERWMKSSTSSFSRDIKIFINPTAKELKEGNTWVRGFIAPDGNIYLGSQGIHAEIAEIIQNDISIKNSVPVLIDNWTNKRTKITLGDYIEKTIYRNNRQDAMNVIKSNMWVKRMYPNGNIMDWMYP